jgi:protein gp37
MRIAARLARMGGKSGARYAGLTRIERSGPVWTGEVRVAEDRLGWPLVRRQPRHIAVDMMSDLFHENLATGTIDLVHAAMRAAHWHHFLILTKRAERMRAYYTDPETPHRIAENADILSSVILRTAGSRRRPAGRREPRVGDARVSGIDRWPLPNLWLGVSVEDHARIARVRDLLETPAAVRWVCFEPLIDLVRPDAVPVGDGYFDAVAGGHYIIDGRGRPAATEGPAWRPLDWVVAGGEIGAGARPMYPRWVRNLRDICVAAGVPFFLGQWGEWAPAPDQTMIRVGKRAAGRLLDGRTWDEIPVPFRPG